MEAKEKKLFHSRPLFYSFLAMLLAISTTKFLFDGQTKYIVFVVALLAVLTVYCFWSKSFLSLILILAFFLFGMGWFYVGVSTFEGNVYSSTCHVQGRISDDISYSSYGNSANVVLKDVYINGEKESNIKLQIYIENQNQFSAGDIIEFYAEVDNAQLFSLGQFNNSYYRDRTPYTSQVSIEDVTFLGNDLNFDESFRLEMKDVLYEHMGERNGAVAMAVLFGDKSEVEIDIYESYRTSGIIHLLTVSGLHVSFLIGLLGFFLKKLKVKGILNFAICVIFLSLYAYICGFAPSILRAGIMGLVLLGAKLSGKCYDNLTTLGLAGIVILLVSPLSALDLGFLMSFFCVLGIFVITPWMTKVLRKVFPKFVAESFAVSIGAQIGILPFVAQIYAGINLLTFFVNLIVIPIFSVLYPVLFVGVFLAALLPFFGFILQVCGGGLTLVFEISSFFGQTYLITWLEPFDIFFTAAMFVLFFLLSKFFMVSKKVKVVSCLVVSCIGVVFAVVPYIPTTPKPALSYAFNYSTGVVLLTNSQNSSILVDCGYTDFTKRLLDATNVSDVSAAFVLNRTTANIDTVRELGIDYLFRTGSGQGYDEEILVNLGETYTLDGFEFSFAENDGRLVGLEITFDSTKVLILRNVNISEDVLENLSENAYDFVLIGKKTDYADYFSSQSRVLSYYRNDFSDASFLESGNVSYVINGNNYKRRVID